MRRIAAVLAVAVGLTLAGFVVVEHLFSRSADAQAIADHYRPLLSSRGLPGLRGGFAELERAGAQLSGEALPRLQQSLGMDDREFSAYVAATMPGIQAFDEQAPAVVALVDPVIAKMEAIREDYRRADSIPVGFLSLTSAPWLFLGIGLLLVAVGAFALVRPGAPAGVALAVVGLGIALVPVVLGFSDDWTRTLSAQSHALSDSQVALAPTFANADRIPLEPIPWLFIVPGTVLAVLGGGHAGPHGPPAPGPGGRHTAPPRAPCL